MHITSRAVSSSANALVERGATEHDERFEVLCDTHRIGASGDLVVGESGAHVGLEFDTASVELVERVVHLQHVAGGLFALGVGVVHRDGIGEVVDDRVVVGALVEHDLDRVGGDPAARLAAVVALERGVTLGGEEVANCDVAELGVTPLVPGHFDALFLGIAERQRVRDITTASGLGGVRFGRVRCVGGVRCLGSVGCVGGVRRLGDRGGRVGAAVGVVVVIIAAAGCQDDAGDQCHDEHDRSDRPPLLESVRRGAPALCLCWLHDLLRSP